MNITGLQFFGRQDPAVDEFFDTNQQFDINAPLLPNERSLRSSAALIYDAVYFFARALSKFVEQYPFTIVPLTCDAQKPWEHGSAFALFLKKVGIAILNIHFVPIFH